MNTDKKARFCPECQERITEGECPRCHVKTQRVKLERTTADLANDTEVEKHIKQLKRRII